MFNDLYLIYNNIDSIDPLCLDRGSIFRQDEKKL